MVESTPAPAPLPRPIKNTKKFTCDLYFLQRKNLKVEKNYKSHVTFIFEYLLFCPSPQILPYSSPPPLTKVGLVGVEV